MTSRQKGLYIVAKLYELAAEFTDDELQRISSDQVRQPKSSAIQKAIEALIQLHREVENREPQSIQKHIEAPTQRYIPPSAETSSLSELLSDRESFPTVSDIASVLEIPARPKESRDRYIARVARQIDSMDSRSRAKFFNRIAGALQTRSRGFLSDWSKLIKEM